MTKKELVTVPVDDEWRWMMLRWADEGGKRSWPERDYYGWCTDGIFTGWEEFPSVVRSLALDGLE